MMATSAGNVTSWKGSQRSIEIGLSMNDYGWEPRVILRVVEKTLLPILVCNGVHIVHDVLMHV